MPADDLPEFSSPSSANLAPPDIDPAPLSQETRRLQLFSRIAKAVASDFDLASLVQEVTDAATECSGAKFGAFFYNVTDEKGDIYSLYTLSGVPRDAFEGFPMPRKTEIFAPTFDGTGIVRSADIRKDPRFGKNGPHFGMPKGHLPVVSYLAVPVISRTGEVHGGLFLAHDKPGVFTQDSEEIVTAIAAHAAIAIDNAQFYEESRREANARRSAHDANARLAAIVESSDDAIISKNLDGTILSWNAGAQRLFGYSPDEVIGKSITILIPDDRIQEEDEIIGRIRRGERIDHFETVRRRKDGALLDISLTVSPVRDETGRIIGASKVARDITDRVRTQERQDLLLREMNHRVKNLFALTSSLVMMTSKTCETSQELASAVLPRIYALARAHELTLPDLGRETEANKTTTLSELLRVIVAPHEGTLLRVEISGCDVQVGGSALTSLALLLHEFATNAAKYGALSASEGHLSIHAEIVGESVKLTWIESGGPAVEGPQIVEGFGSKLERTAIQGSLRGQIDREWRPDGLTITLTVPLNKLVA